MKVPATLPGWSLGKTLGQSAVTAVFEVCGSGQRAVCKRLTRRGLEAPRALDGFRSEMALLKHLEGLAVPKVLASGDDENGPFLLLEPLDAPSLGDRILGAVSAEWASRAVAVSLAALARLHGAEDEGGPLHFVHGDIHPGNVVVDEGAREAFFLDFGLSLWREHRPPEDGTFRGNLLYAAPEVAQGALPTQASDFFSLAATWLHVVGGIPPRQARVPAALLQEAAEASLVAWGQRAAGGLEASMAARLLRCLSPDPEARLP